MHPDLIHRLRQLFADGAAFSGLVRCIIENHPDGRATPGVVRQYIMEAFAVPFHEPVKMNLEDSETDDQYAAISAFLIPEILATRSQWSPDADEVGQTWMDKLQLTDAGELHQTIAAKGPAGLSEASLKAMSAVEHERLCQLEVSSRILSERVLVLARLAEQLQRKVSELSKELDARAAQTK